MDRDVVHRQQQLMRAGVSRNAVTAKVRYGRRQTLHPGVYATFTGTVSWEGRLWAAALYCGPGAISAHLG